MTAHIERTGLDPAVPAAPPAEPRRWWGRHLAEVRWQAELARLLVDPVFRGDGVPRGDGAPVAAGPGLPRRRHLARRDAGWLARIGYDAHGSGIVSNVDCSDRALEPARRARSSASTRAPGRRVALIGHSRGGHFAKALAHRRPERVAGVISLGAGLDTPFDISVPTKAAVAAVRAVHAQAPPRARTGCFTERCGCAFASDYAGAVPRARSR